MLMLCYGPEELRRRRGCRRYAMSISLARWKNVEKNVFKYCGRDVVKDKDGIHITCPSLIDRVRPIYLPVRKKKQEKITEAQRQQLRSIIGSLAWLARVCRPDLAYAASKLQSNVHTATYEDIRYANTVTSIAHKTKSAGIHCPLRAFRFEDAVIVGMQDSSFANDHDVNSEGKKLEFRSQSGRLLGLGPPKFKEAKQGQLLLLDNQARVPFDPSSGGHVFDFWHGGGRARAYDASWTMPSTSPRRSTMADQCNGRQEHRAVQGLQKSGRKCEPVRASHSGRQKAGDRSERSEAKNMEASRSRDWTSAADGPPSSRSHHEIVVGEHREDVSGQSYREHEAKDAFASHGRSVDRFNSRQR